MINKILVATDASEVSGRAVSVAAELAHVHEAELLILNVIRDMQLPDELKQAPEYETFNNSREQFMRHSADKILKDARRRAEQSGAQEVQTAIGCGDPATSLVGFARRRGVDLIVVGTRGLSRSDNSHLGSVSRKLLDLADINCLVVR